MAAQMKSPSQRCAGLTGAWQIMRARRANPHIAYSGRTVSASQSAEMKRREPARPAPFLMPLGGCPA